MIFWAKYGLYEQCVKGQLMTAAKVKATRIGIGKVEEEERIGFLTFEHHMNA